MTDSVGPINDLALFLARMVRDSEVPQRALKERTGYSEKHISSMLCAGQGSTKAWSDLLHAAGIRLEAS